MRHPIRTLIGAAIALVLLLAAAGSVAAHEISGIDVRCSRHVIHVEGIKFAEELPRVVTVTGPAGYSRSFTVTTDSWSHNFPLGPNGAYSIDWPNSGDFGPVPFLVDCAAPTPNVPRVTPHPDRTLPPTDSTTIHTEPLFDWTVIPVVGLVLIAITGIVEGYLKRRAGR